MEKVYSKIKKIKTKYISGLEDLGDSVYWRFWHRWILIASKIQGLSLVGITMVELKSKYIPESSRYDGGVRGADSIWRALWFNTLLDLNDRIQWQSQ